MNTYTVTTIDFSFTISADIMTRADGEICFWSFESGLLCSYPDHDVIIK